MESNVVDVQEVREVTNPEFKKGNYKISVKGTDGVIKSIAVVNSGIEIIELEDSFVIDLVK